MFKPLDHLVTSSVHREQSPCLDLDGAVGRSDRSARALVVMRVPGLPGGEGVSRGKLVMVTFVFPSLSTLHSVFPGC